MTKIEDEQINEQIRSLAKQLSRYDQIGFIGYLTWLLWCEKLHLPTPDLKAPAGWTEPVFFLVGLASNGYLAVYLPASRWWSDLQIRWLLWVWF